MNFRTWFRRGGDFPNGNPAQVAPPIDWNEGAVRALPGVSITAENAVSISALFRAVHLVATTIASFPIGVIEEQEDGTRKPVKYEVDSCLWKKPNHEMTKVEFWSVVVGHVVLNGNSFLYVRPEEGGTYSLWPIEPERVEVARDENNGQKFYRVDGQKVFTDFRAGGNIIHIAGWGRNGLVGVSPVGKMATSLGLAKATEEYAARYFGSGTTLSGVLSTDQQLTPDQAKQFKERWDSSHRGLGTAHEIAVLSNGLKFQSAANTPDDSQMTDVRNFQVAEIGRIVGVPEHLIGSHDKNSSWGQGLEINNRAFVQFGLMHHILRLEQAITDDFLGTVNPNVKLYARQMKFNVNGLMRGTNAERAAFYWQMFQMGAFTINKILELEDLPGIGPEGDERFIPGNNLVPLTQVLAPADPDAPKGANRVLEQVRQVLQQIETR